MILKEIDDIRILRSSDSRIQHQMTNLHKFVKVSNQPATKRILSYSASKEKTEEDICEFIRVLEDIDVVVRRPQSRDHGLTFGNTHWSVQGYHNYCPRDILTVIADQIIESANVVRSRMFETMSYREILIGYMKSGARWYAAPRPMLHDSLYANGCSRWPTPREYEPAFDSANILRLGTDLLYLVSASGNVMGGNWLQTVLGDRFRVHFVRKVYSGSHIDSTFAALRPGLVLCNPERVNEQNMPVILKQWDRIYSPPMVATAKHDSRKCIGSAWIDMNVFSLGPDLVVVDRDQLPLIRLLEKWSVRTIPLKLRHARLLGGGFHCATLDVRRKGNLDTYFT